MSLEDTLHARSETKCELCGAPENLAAYEVASDSEASAETCALLCETCRTQIENADTTDVHHWHCLNESMWSQVPSVQVLAWRMLTRLSAEPWARDLLDTLYLDEETLAWAQAGIEESSPEAPSDHRDSNGAALAAGDTVTLIKDLNVKGTSFTAKRGTAVRNISLVPDNSEHIEGRINGQQIVILTKFVKKSA